jgi:hypothetical protein
VTLNTKATNPKVENFLVNSVKENKKGFTARQFEDAKQARNPSHILGCPTVKNFKAILRQNSIQNCPMTVVDVSNAKKSFDPISEHYKGNPLGNHLFP